MYVRPLSWPPSPLCIWRLNFLWQISSKECTCNSSIKSLRPRQNGSHFADDIFKCIFLNENIWVSLEIFPKFVPEVRINNIPALVPIMAWCRSGDKSLSEPMMVSLLTHICVTRPHWVNEWVQYQHHELQHVMQSRQFIPMPPGALWKQFFRYLSTVLTDAYQLFPMMCSPKYVSFNTAIDISAIQMLSSTHWSCEKDGCNLDLALPKLIWK